MPIRNPFKKSITAEQLHEQNLRDNAANGFKTVDVSGKGMEIKEPTEYQLSGKRGLCTDGASATSFCAYWNCADHVTEINDSGVYVPV